MLYSGQGGALYRTPWCLNCGIFKERTGGIKHRIDGTQAVKYSDHRLHVPIDYIITVESDGIQYGFSRSMSSIHSC